MGHGNSDRLYVTRDEMSGVHGNHTAGGGRRLKASNVGFERLPFDCCALSLQPWSIPVCSAAEGTIFELTNIIPFLKKHGVNPATGVKLEAKDLVRLNFRKNAKGNYRDPVSFKEFNEHTHIVAIKTSGNVFSHETIQQLNIKAKYMHDLVDDTPFSKKDLVTLQDPHNIESRNVNDLHHIKTGLKWSKADEKEGDVNTHATGSTSKVLAQLKRKVEPSSEAYAASPKRGIQGEDGRGEARDAVSLPQQEQKKKAPYNSTNSTTGMMAASFTSSGLSVRTTNGRKLIDEEEYMFEQVASGQSLTKGKASKRVKGYVRLETNFGPLDIELHVDKAPKTCYNFLELCKMQRYDDTTFHRLIPGFMIQGGDPTGTGRGGESIWGQPFRDEYDTSGAYRHTHRGTISMANKGANTNGSQWFIAFRKLSHLDTKHTVFGQLVDDEEPSSTKTKSLSMQTLDKMEDVPTEPKTDRPLRSVRILQTYVLDNPFDDWKAQLEKRLARENMSEEDLVAREAKRRKREEDRTTWLGTNLDTDKIGQKQDSCKDFKVNLTSGVGKYLPQNPQASLTASMQKSGPPHKGKATGAGGFGDFTSW